MKNRYSYKASIADCDYPYTYYEILDNNPESEFNGCLELSTTNENEIKLVVKALNLYEEFGDVSTE